MGKNLYSSPTLGIKTVLQGYVITMSTGFDSDEYDNEFSLGGENL